MTKLAPEWVRTSDPVIRSPARYRQTTAPAPNLHEKLTNIEIMSSWSRFKHCSKSLAQPIGIHTFHIWSLCIPINKLQSVQTLLKITHLCPGSHIWSLFASLHKKVQYNQLINNQAFPPGIFFFSFFGFGFFRRHGFQMITFETPGQIVPKFPPVMGHGQRKKCIVF